MNKQSPLVKLLDYVDREHELEVNPYPFAIVGTQTLSYSYVPNSDLLHQVTSTSELTTTRTYESLSTTEPVRSWKP